MVSIHSTVHTYSCISWTYEYQKRIHKNTAGTTNTHYLSIKHLIFIKKQGFFREPGLGQKSYNKIQEYFVLYSKEILQNYGSLHKGTTFPVKLLTGQIWRNISIKIYTYTIKAVHYSCQVLHQHASMLYWTLPWSFMYSMLICVMTQNNRTHCIKQILWQQKTKVQGSYTERYQLLI